MKRKRRATILLMVVSLLALLFVIVTGFLSLARTNRGITEDISKSDLIDTIAEDMTEMAASLIKDQLVDASGKVMAGGSAQDCSYEDIPGYRSTSYLASLEPVWDPAWNGSAFGWNGSLTNLERLRWPAVTSLDGNIKKPQSFALYELMRDYRPGYDNFLQSDVEWNVRNPFMDADGDGVPDSHFLLSAPATEAANTMAGTSVQLPRLGDGSGFQIWQLPPDTDTSLNDEKWNRYDETARYEVAVRVISHGGMVTINSPTLHHPQNYDTTYAPFNRDFILDMFDAVKNQHIRERRMRNAYSGNFETDGHRFFDEVEANQSAVELGLRRRFMLPGPPCAFEDVGRLSPKWVRRVPSILSEMQGEETDEHRGFPRTLVPQFIVPGPALAASEYPSNWQRINLADERLRFGWAKTVAYDPQTYYFQGPSGGASQLEPVYDRRHLVTVTNYSDELARKQETGEPNPMVSAPFTLGGSGGATFEGELKFYLGEISKAFLEVDSITNVLTDDCGEYVFDRDNRGKLVVQQLARIYNDMLAGHTGANDDWVSLYPYGIGSSNRQAVSRRQQAMMLAVNTVAFATPRNIDNLGHGSDGFVDVVRYTDDNETPFDTNDDITYVGYGPQLFFSEVIAFTDKEEEGEEDDNPDTSLAVELYNPNDPFYDFGVTGPPYPDVYALRLDQYAISADIGGTPSATKVQLASAYVDGRSFVTIAIHDSTDANAHFDNIATDVLSGTRSLDIVSTRVSGGGGKGGGPPGESQTTEKITLKLWRKSAAGPNTLWPVGWHCVDKIDVDVPVYDGTVRRWRGVHRDTTPTRYFGMVDLNGDGAITGDQPPNGEDVSGDAPNGIPDTFARWGAVFSNTQGQGNGGVCSGSPNKDSLNNHTWLERLSTGSATGDTVDPDVWDNVNPFAPIVPLITMNAGPDPSLTAHTALYKRINSLPMFGNANDLRPRSFPTVGFMTFIPRFSHVFKATAGNDAYLPIGYVLKEQWRRQSYAGYQQGSYPADFGHMPLFDNTQNVPNDSYFDKSNGIGNVPWGQLIFDYFTTIDPTRDANGDDEPDVDPLKIPGRININNAPWFVLSQLPILGPTDGAVPPSANAELPLRWTVIGGMDTPVNSSLGPWAPSPSFWDPAVGVLVGFAYDVVNGTRTTWRLLMQDGTYQVPPAENMSVPYPADGKGRYRLGPWLAQAAAAYRDGVQYLPYSGATTLGSGYEIYADAHLHGVGQYKAINGQPVSSIRYRNNSVYGPVRGEPTNGTDIVPKEYGFTSIGELLNVKGVDSTSYSDLPPYPGATQNTGILGNAYVDCGDYVKAVSIVALLDSQYLTTRSNTFTVYTSVMDREDPEASVHTQATYDRSNMLPRLTYAYSYVDTAGVTKPWNPSDPLDPTYAQYPLAPLLLDSDADTVPETPVCTKHADEEPRVIAEEQVGYFNARYDD